MSRLSQIHEDYLDPDKHLWTEEVPPHITITRAQRIAAKRVYHRHVDQLEIAYREFRRSFYLLIGGGGCVMVPLPWITLGIETDGHTHS